MADYENLLFIHDGGVDDYIATALVCTMKTVRLLGIVITPADCYLDPACSATRKLLDLVGCSHVPVAKSTVRGINPFPSAFRSGSCSIDLFPILNEKLLSHQEPRTPLVKEDGPEFIVNLLRAHNGPPVTVLDTGPLTTLAAALSLASDIAPKISRLLWMGGALRVAGNIDHLVEPSGHDGSAEWNVYWDPLAADAIFRSKLANIIMCPLDVTNNVPVIPAFVRKLSNQRSFPLSDFAGQCYSLVAFRPYFFWDVLTAAFLSRPDLFTTRTCSVMVITHGPSQGRTVELDKDDANGRTVQVLTTVDVLTFYDYVLQALRQ